MQIAKFANDLFGEPFEPEDVILGEREDINFSSKVQLNASSYLALNDWLNDSNSVSSSTISEMADAVGMSDTSALSQETVIANILVRDSRTIDLINRIADVPQELGDASQHTFPELQADEQLRILICLLELLVSRTFFRSWMGAPKTSRL